MLYFFYDVTYRGHSMAGISACSFYEFVEELIICYNVQCKNKVNSKNINHIQSKNKNDRVLD